MSATMTGMIIDATWQTLLMVLIPCAITLLLGLPLGVLLLVTRKHHILANVYINPV